MTTIHAHHPAGAGIPVGPGLELRVPAATTAGAISIHEGVLAPGDEVGAHVHDTTDQALYVIEGEMTVGGDTFVATGGDFVSQPHGVLHGFENRGDQPARLLEISAGDRFERFTLAAAAATDPAEFPRLQVEHGVHTAAH